MEAEGQYSKLVSDIPDPDITISLGCNVGCPFIGRPFDDNWGCLLYTSCYISTACLTSLFFQLTNPYMSFTKNRTKFTTTGIYAGFSKDARTHNTMSTTSVSYTHLDVYKRQLSQ